MVLGLGPHLSSDGPHRGPAPVTPVLTPLRHFLPAVHAHVPGSVWGGSVCPEWLLPRDAVGLGLRLPGYGLASPRGRLTRGRWRHGQS